MAYGSTPLKYETLDDKKTRESRTSQTSQSIKPFEDNNNNNNSGRQTVTDPILSQRLRDIQQREQDAINLQRELDDKERQLYGTENRPRNLPKNWPSKSLAWARNDISVDIPPSQRLLVRQFYILWCITALAVSCNFIVINWYEMGYDGGIDFGILLLSGIYLCVFLPCTWLFIYKKFYYAMQHNTQLSYIFFCVLMIHILWTGIMASGLDPSIGTAGYLIMVREFVNEHHAIGLALAISGSLWAVNCLYSLYLLKIAQRTLGRYLASKYQNNEL